MFPVKKLSARTQTPVTYTLLKATVPLLDRKDRIQTKTDLEFKGMKPAARDGSSNFRCNILKSFEDCGRWDHKARPARLIDTRRIPL